MASDPKVDEVVKNSEAAPEAEAPKAETSIVATDRQATLIKAEDIDDPVALYLNSDIFAQIQRVAKLMISSHLIPGHLQGGDKLADCFLVVAQAFRWRMDPFAVAQHTYVVKGRLGYEGKLVAGVINASGKLTGSLAYDYSSEGPDRAVRVAGRLRGEDAMRDVTGTVRRWRTDNDNWTDNPDQMLAYRGAREWARRHMPEAILGIQTDDEIHMRRVANGTYAPMPSAVISVETLGKATAEATTDPAAEASPPEPPKSDSKKKGGKKKTTKDEPKPSPEDGPTMADQAADLFKDD